MSTTKTHRRCFTSIMWILKLKRVHVNIVEPKYTFQTFWMYVPSKPQVGSQILNNFNIRCTQHHWHANPLLDGIFLKCWEHLLQMSPILAQGISFTTYHWPYYVVDKFLLWLSSFLTPAKLSKRTVRSRRNHMFLLSMTQSPIHWNRWLDEQLAGKESRTACELELSRAAVLSYRPLLPDRATRL